jgi:uncharacterized protein YprB with RNaseH-like and TPR domain
MHISLGDRLRQVVTGAVPRVADTTSLDAPAPRPHGGTRLDGFKAADVLGGQWIESADGAVLVVDRYYAADRFHGREPIGPIVETLEAGRDALAVLARAWPRVGGTPFDSRNSPLAQGRKVAPSDTYGPQLCFFDLETTGLAGGAGTQAFLVGCAILADGGLRVRQFLLPGFEHERALLAMVAEWIARQGTLVSFNGRSFDVPLIETRYLLHRFAFPLAHMPHLDMLHPARRLWKQRPVVAGPPLDDDCCKLSVLERHLAGYHRVGDVPGFEIPSRYFRFVRCGDPYPLEAVMEHNRIDLISLALVTARALQLIEQGPSAASHPRESLGLGHVFERAGRCDEAEACFAHAAAFSARTGREPEIHGESLRRLALSRRRAGRMAEAAAAWKELVCLASCPSALRREAREALAIHHEHRVRDLQAARLLVLEVLAETPGQRWRERAEYRLRRIERKMTVRKRGGLMAALEDES